MDRNQAKRLLPIIQAFAEGKAIQLKTVDKGWQDIHSASFDSNPKNYRIKTEPKYRPFKDAEECWQEMQKHQPFGWLKSKYDGHLTLITVVDNEDMMALSGNSGWDFLGILKTYTFADGTPFGVKIEKEE